MIETLGSTYVVQIVDEGSCVVTGGWFDRNGSSPHRTRVVGATLGGSAVAMNLLAACGMRVEFGNRVITSTVRRLVVFKQPTLN